MAELRPCPFCGGTQIEVYHNPNNKLMYFGIEQYKVSCLRCAAQLHREKKEEAIAAWNRRAKEKT